MSFLGRLHPLVVHFPIGLLVVALFLEGLTLGGKRKGLREGIQMMVCLGAGFAIVSALFGWALRYYGDYEGELVQDHLNLGVATAVLSGITALLLRSTLKGKLHDYIAYRTALIATVILLTLTGHLGASLTHGENYLRGMLSAPSSYNAGISSELLVRFSSLDTLSESQQDELNLGVRAILAHNCYQCHSSNKQKGELVLDNKRGVFKGGKSGPIITAGLPDDSELFYRINLPPDDEDVMPKKGKLLQADEIELIKLWIQKGAHWSDRPLKVFPEAELALTKPELPKSSNQNHSIDRLIDAYFIKNDVVWNHPVDDHTFIRRAYLDIVGLLPELENIRQFIDNPHPDKRGRLIDELLSDQHNYTQHWLSFWNDLLRNDYSGPGFITGGRKQITSWLYRSLLENKPYDLMVKELVDPTAVSEGFIKGIRWRGVVNSSQSTEMQAAQNIGQSLMGVNVKCASCHNSFVSNLTLEQSYGFATIFSDTILELNRCDQPLGKLAKANFLYPELGPVEAESVKERLALLSEVMVRPENGRMYRTITNRIWKRLMGRGIVEPADEMDNPPWDAKVLDWLASDFIDSGYDLKHLIRRIMTSKSYQLPSVPYGKVEDIKSSYVFEGPIIRRLSAEQFSDAVSQLFAPMFHAVEYDPQNEDLNSNRIWHREIKFDRDVLPEPGKRYFRHLFTLPDKVIQKADGLISVDQSYIIYVNGKKIFNGSDWRKVDKLDLKEMLQKGKNLIAIEGTNEGPIANPAGILFALRLIYEDGGEMLIQSDNTWKSTAEPPGENWTSMQFSDVDWEKVRDYGSQQWGKLVNFNFNGPKQKFARASLVKQHPFMKAMGRPSRENVATSRDDQATLLQALELTNGIYFNSVLAEGAGLWLKEFGHQNELLVETLYHRSLGRAPTAQEKKLMLSALEVAPREEALQDLFWSTLNLPAFQFIY
jgi:uncharacterized membrane protein/mono/diheme cytochrome c family protein